MENQNTLAAQFQEIKQQILCGATTLSSLVRQNGEAWLDSFQKEFQDAQWFLTEEQNKRQFLERELEGKNKHVQCLESELQKLRDSFNESQWFLGEERSKRESLDGALKASQQRCQELEGQLNGTREYCDKLKKELADAQWFLGEERAKHR